MTPDGFWLGFYFGGIIIGSGVSTIYLTYLSRKQNTKTQESQS